MTRVDFGIWDHFEHQPGIEPHQQYAEKIKLLQEAERLGFYCYHLAEHHITPLDIAPSPAVFLAALAQATTRIRIGTMVFILPLHHPVRFIQELCMLDNLSNGRLDVGVGPGSRRTIEFQWFGQVGRNESRPIFDETLEIFVNGLTKGNLAWDGQHYKIPNAPLDLLPVQKPYPPLWYAAGEFAGRHGMNFFTRSLDDVARYWDLWEETKHRPDRFNPQVETPVAGITKHVLIRENEQDALRIARRAWPVFNEHWNATPTDDTQGARSAAAGAVHDDFDEALADHSRLLVGTPATIRDYLEQYVERFKDKPMVYFAPAFQWGDLTHEEALETIELFASEVMRGFQPASASRA